MSSPMRVIMRMFTTTYSESVICTPYLENLDPVGPMQNGITYKVRPLMQPFMRPFRTDFIFLGSIQLLVGPASIFNLLQIKVRSSTLATSLESLKQAKLFGCFLESSFMKVPLLTNF